MIGAETSCHGTVNKKMILNKFFRLWCLFVGFWCLFGSIDLYAATQLKDGVTKVNHISESLALKKAPLFKKRRVMKRRMFNLEESLKQGPVLINFWATWCGPCIVEMKDMMGLSDLFKHKNVQVVSISIDSIEQRSSIKKLVKKHQFPYIILHDDLQEIYSMFAPRMIPFTVLVNQAGFVVYQSTGYTKFSLDNLSNAIQSL